MRCTLLISVVVDGDDLLFRKDTVLPGMDFKTTAEIYILREFGESVVPPYFQTRIDGDAPVEVLEGQSRLVLTLARPGGNGPYDEWTPTQWRKFLVAYGFYETDEANPINLTPWSVRKASGTSPDHPSPCCGFESAPTGQIGTAYIYSCGLCGSRFHYAGGVAIPGLPPQQEPGTALPDELVPLDPTLATKPARSVVADPGCHPDGFPGTDEGSHYMSQTRIVPPHKCCCPATPCPVHKTR